MPSISNSSEVVINAPPQVVFENLTDLKRHSEWASNEQTIEALSEGPVAQGSKFRSSTKFMGKTIVANLQVVACEPPSHFAFSVSDSTGEYVHDCTLTAEGDMTRVVHRVSGSMPMMMYVTYLLGGWFMGRSAAKKFNNRMKVAIESAVTR